MVLVRSEGGCVGEECLFVSEGGPPRVDQRAILFLVNHGPDYATVLGASGQYEIRAGRSTIPCGAGMRLSATRPSRGSTGFRWQSCFGLFVRVQDIANTFARRVYFGEGPGHR